jgi:hypothetical protein
VAVNTAGDHGGGAAEKSVGLGEVQTEAETDFFNH